MSATSNIIRWAGLPSTQRRLLAEAGWRLFLAWAAVRFLSFRRALTSSAVALGRRAETDNLRQFTWAVKAAASRAPFRAVCFQRALALQAMLRTRGIDARLHYGVGNEEDRKLAAHVWVSVDGQIIIGGDEAGRFEQMVTVP